MVLELGGEGEDWDEVDSTNDFSVQPAGLVDAHNSKREDANRCCAFALLVPYIRRPKQLEVVQHTICL